MPRRPELQQISKSLFSMGHPAQFPLDRRLKRMGRRMVLSDLARMKVTRRRRRWRKTATCPWKLPPMRNDYVAKGGQDRRAWGCALIAWNFSVGCPPMRSTFPSGWAGPIGDNNLAGDVQVHGLTYETEPDEEICSGRDALSVCNLRHGIRGVARVDKKGRSARFWMILRRHNELLGNQQYPVLPFGPRRERVVHLRRS